MRFLAALLITTALASTASAQSVVDSLAADETRLTIYPKNLAMVTEVRKVTLPKGNTTLRLFGVSDQIIPQTVVLQAFEGFSIEQNFTSDLLSKGSLLANAIGETVTIARVNPATGEVTRDEATLVSAAQSTASGRQWDYQTQSYANVMPVMGAVFEIDGDIEAFECSGLGEAIAFRRIPETLNPTPVLSIDVSSEIAGEAELVVSYLSSGISWAADYRVDVNTDHTEGAMLGWLTVTNSTAKTFKEVETAIVAGEVNRRGETNGTSPVQKTFQASCWQKGTTKMGTPQTWPPEVTQSASYRGRSELSELSAPAPMMLKMDNDEIVVTGARIATREDLGDYKLYRTPQPVTVAAHQTKQVAFLSVPDAALERLYKFNYTFEPSTEPYGATVQYEIDNSKESKLAQPLPKGTMRVMTQRANGRPAYLGEDSVDNLAVDLPVEIEISTSPSVLSSEEAIGITNTVPLPTEHTLRLSGEIFNATSEGILAEVELKNKFIRAHNISGSSHKLDPDEIVPTFKIPVSAETSQDYYVNLPVERIFSFIESDVIFKNDKPGETDFNYPDVEYRLAGQYGGDAWPTEYFPGVDDDVEMTSTLLTYSESETAEEETDSTARLRHVFQNDMGTDVRVRFIVDADDDDLDVEIIDPSFAPKGNDPIVWQFDLKAGETKTLEYTRRTLTK